MDYGALIDHVTKHGYCIMPGFFSRAEIEPVRTELAGILDEDLEHRRRSNVQATDEVRDGYFYSLTPHLHNLLFPAFKSKATAMLLERIITDGVIAGFLK